MLQGRSISSKANLVEALVQICRHNCALYNVREEEHLLYESPRVEVGGNEEAYLCGASIS